MWVHVALPTLLVLASHRRFGGSMRMGEGPHWCPFPVAKRVCPGWQSRRTGDTGVFTMSGDAALTALADASLFLSPSRTTRAPVPLHASRPYQRRMRN